MNQLNLQRAVLSLCLATTLSAGVRANYTQVNLFSDGQVPGTQSDPNFINPWGIAYSPSGPMWINVNGSGQSMVFAPMAPVQPSAMFSVGIPPVGESAPTGIVYNGSRGFAIEKNGVRQPSTFIFVTENGRIAGWNGALDRNNALLVPSTYMNNAVYKGAAIATSFLGQTLYATDFRNGKVDAFNSNFHHVFSFTDPRLPKGFSPFNVKNINGLLVVTFALRDADGEDDVPGPGNGYVDVFTPNGVFMSRLVNRGHLNSPWGIALAPAGKFGLHSGQLLVGNFGDGKINTYDMAGQWKGMMMKSNRGVSAVTDQIVIPGLWEIIFGNGAKGGDADTLYFTAGTGGEEHGLFGMIKAS